MNGAQWVSLVTLSVLTGSGLCAEPWVETTIRRQTAFHTVDIEFELTEFVAKATYPLLPVPGIDTKNPQPATDQTTRSTNRLLVQQEMACLEYNHPTWDIKNKRHNPTTRIRVNRGTDNRMFYPTGMALNPKPDGVLLKESRAEGINVVYLNVLTYCICGQSAAFRGKLAVDLRPPGTQHKVGPHVCTQLTVRENEKNIFCYDLDPIIDYLPRHIRYISGDRVLNECQAEYVQESDGLWRPSTWTTTTFTKER